jgi:LuxR family maltose regulon positive regulatory protein
VSQPLGRIATKFVPPVPRAGAVDRPELMARLAGSTSTRLVLLAAPAGSGKTTVVAQWLGSGRYSATPTAWVSLDPADADPVRFWTHILTAIEQLVPGAGAPGLELLDASRPPAIESVLGECVNALVTHTREVVLIVDDYHLVDGAGPADGIHRGMTFLVEHLPHHVRLVLSTRSDPPLPLARLRARAQLWR